MTVHILLYYLHFPLCIYYYGGCVLTTPTAPPTQEEMSHALATMRVEDSSKIKTISESTNPLLARRAKKKAKAGK